MRKTTICVVEQDTSLIGRKSTVFNRKFSFGGTVCDDKFLVFFS